MFFAWLDFKRAVALAAGIVLAGGLFGGGIEVSSALSGDEPPAVAQGADLATQAEPTTSPQAAVATAAAAPSATTLPAAAPRPTAAPHGAVAPSEAPVAIVTVAPSPSVIADSGSPSPRPAEQTPKATAPTTRSTAAALPSREPARTRQSAPASARTAAPSAPADVQTTAVVGSWTAPSIVPPGSWQLGKPQVTSGAPVQVSVSGCSAGCAFAAGELFIKAPAGRVTVTWSAPAVDGFTSWSKSTSVNWG